MAIVRILTKYRQFNVEFRITNDMHSFTGIPLKHSDFIKIINTTLDNVVKSSKKKYKINDVTPVFFKH